jgi:hypothetical protein
MVAKHTGPVYMSKKNAYELRWVKLAEVSEDSQRDLKNEPVSRKYAPWVHAVFSLPPRKVEEAFLPT